MYFCNLRCFCIWSVQLATRPNLSVETEHFGAHDLRRTCAKLCRKNGGDLEQIKFLLGHSSIQTNAIWAPSRISRST